MRLERTSSRVRSSGASSSISSSKVRLASSIIAHSSPRTSMPWPARRLGSTRWGSLPSSSTPSALASRRAGSMVTTATRAPCAARPMASAADVVVLPTPPEPAQTMMRLSRRRAFTACLPARRARVASRSPSSKTCGSVVTVARARRRRRRSCARWAPARAWAWRAARTSGPSGAASSARTSVGVKRWGSMPLQITSSTSTPTPSRSVSCSASVSLTGISSGRATTITPVRLGSQTIASIVRPWRAMRPMRAVCAKVRGALRTATPWPVAGASRMTRS